MVSYKNTRILPVALTLIIIAIVIAIVISLARVIFFSGGGTSSLPADVSRETLVNTSSDSAVRMVVRGPIVANEDFRSYQITITPNSRVITGYTGYLNQPIDSISLGNNVSAYEQFVYALDKANLAKGVELTGSANDMRGACASGRVYKFEMLKTDKPVKTLWASSCTGEKGSLVAKVSQLTSLFNGQIPDADLFVDKIF